VTCEVRGSASHITTVPWADAIFVGDDELVERILSYSDDVRNLGEALHFACEMGMDNIVEGILAKPAGTQALTYRSGAREAILAHEIDSVWCIHIPFTEGWPSPRARRPSPTGPGSEGREAILAPDMGRTLVYTFRRRVATVWIRQGFCVPCILTECPGWAKDQAARCAVVRRAIPLGRTPDRELQFVFYPGGKTALHVAAAKGSVPCIRVGYDLGSLMRDATDDV
jgi:hypothetical protein